MLTNDPSLVSVDVPNGQDDGFGVVLEMQGDNALALVDQRGHHYRFRSVMPRLKHKQPYVVLDNDFTRTFDDLPECLQSKLLMYEASGKQHNEHNGLGVRHFIAPHPQPPVETFMIQIVDADDLHELFQATGVEL